MLISKKKILSLMVLLVFLFSSLSFSTDVSAKKSVVSDKEKKKIAAEIKKLEKSYQNLQSKTTDTGENLLLVIKESDNTIELIVKAEKQTGDYSSFKGSKKDLVDTSDEINLIYPSIYKPYKLISSEIKTLKGTYKKQSYKESSKQINGIKSDISDGLNMIKEVNNMIDTTNESLKKIQNSVQPLL